MTGIVIKDGHGKGGRLKINGEGEIPVVIHTHPPVDEIVESYPFRQYLTSDGTGGGSNDLIVDGSTTPQDFYISAQEDYDIWIKVLSVRIGDTGTVNLGRFGGLTALANGCDIIYSNSVIGEYTIADELKTNLDLTRIGDRTAAVGTGADAFLLDVQGGGTEDTYLPLIDMSTLFGFNWGLRLKKASTDKLIFRVNDDLAGLITFNIIGTGTRL